MDGRWYWIRACLSGITLKMKYWIDGVAEPMTGGPDNDGYQLKVTDATHSAGYFGCYMTNPYTTYQSYFDDFTWNGGYASDSPLRFCEWDSGQGGTTWADTFTIRHNVAASDSGSIKVRVGYSDTQPSTLSEAACDALLGDLKTPDGNGDVTGVGGTGRWRVAAFQFDSDGTQQASLAIFDEAQTVTLGAGDDTPPGLVPWKVNKIQDGLIEGKVIDPPDDEDLDVLRPKYRKYSATSPNEWIDGSDIESPAPGSTFVLNGLTNGTVYEISVVSVDTSGNESGLGTIRRVIPSLGDTAEKIVDAVIAELVDWIPLPNIHRGDAFEGKVRPAGRAALVRCRRVDAERAFTTCAIERYTIEIEIVFEDRRARERLAELARITGEVRRCFDSNIAPFSAIDGYLDTRARIIREPRRIADFTISATVAIEALVAT